MKCTYNNGTGYIITDCLTDSGENLAKCFNHEGDFESNKEGECETCCMNGGCRDKYNIGQCW